MDKILGKIKDNKKICILFLIIVAFILIMTIAFVIIKNSKTSEINSELSNFKNTYLGDNSSVNSIIELLPYADKKEQIELLTSQSPYTLIIKYNMNSTKELLEYNSYKIFELITNVEKIIYRLDNGEIEILKDDIDKEKLNIYSIVEEYLVSLEKPYSGEENEFKTFISAKYFGLDNNRDNIIVYLWAQIENYYKVEQYVLISSGSSMPYKIILKDNKVVEYVIPKDGVEYTESIEENFPKDIINQFDDIYVETSKELHINPSPYASYLGEESILSINIKNEATTYYGINEGQINYANPYTLIVEDDEQNLKKIAENENCDIYLYGINANVGINNEYISLKKALEQKLLLIDKLVKYSESLAVNIFEDNENKLIKCKEYSIIKMYGNLYICKENTTLDTISNLTYDVSKNEKEKIQQYLNKVENNGFVNHVYEEVNKINISMVLYDGAGIGKNLTQEEREYVMQNDYDGNDIGMDMLKFNKENIKKLYEEKTVGLIANNEGGINLNYCEEYDFYYNAHGDTNLINIIITDAKMKKDGTYYIRYERFDGEYEVILNKVDNNYKFVSNKKV